MGRAGWGRGWGVVSFIAAIGCGSEKSVDDASTEPPRALKVVSQHAELGVRAFERSAALVRTGDDIVLDAASLPNARGELKLSATRPARSSSGTASTKPSTCAWLHSNEPSANQPSPAAPSCSATPVPTRTSC
jgi:hypothetical protein